MKKKYDGMSPNMFHDATSSTPIPVFTTTNEENKNDFQNPLQKVTDNFTGVPNGTPVKNQNETEDFTGVPFGTPVKIQNKTEDFTGVPNGTPVKFQVEIIKVNFDKQTVSARALYAFLDMAERFSKWWQRMVSFGLEENIDFTGVNFFTAVNQGAKQDIGDYLLTIDAAKHIAMVQRNEKGKQARDYFINIEKLFLKSATSTQTPSQPPVPLFENLKNIASQCESYLQQVQKNYATQTEVFEKQYFELLQQKNLQTKQVERSVDFFTQKVENALKDLVTEVATDVEDVAPVRTSRKVSTITPINKLPHIYQLWYSELPDLFSTTDAERIGLKYNISRTTIFRMLRNQAFNSELFRKLRYGKYEKYPNK